MPLEQTLSVLCPMHIRLNNTGHITHVGPTLAKLRKESGFVGRRFFEVFELSRPRMIATMDELVTISGRKLYLKFRDTPSTAFKGVLVSLEETGGAIVNLSFGISVVDGISDYALSSADFAPTDLTIEMLYLIEAKSAAMESSRRLNLRLQGAKVEAEEQAFTDTLTGLKNRRAMDHVLERMISLNQAFSIMHLDLDFFKEVNDTLGHAAGDFVLCEVAAMMRAETREDDTVVRVGGDEFVLIFANLVDRRRLSDIASRLIERLEKPLSFEGDACKISGSIGTVRSTDYKNPNAQTMMTDADAALYASKRKGRSRNSFFHSSMRMGADDGAAIARPEIQDVTHQKPPDLDAQQS